MEAEKRKGNLWWLVGLATPAVLCAFSIPRFYEYIVYENNEFGIGPSYNFKDDGKQLQICKSYENQCFTVATSSSPCNFRFSSSGASGSEKLVVRSDKETIERKTNWNAEPVWSGKHQTLFFLERNNPSSGVHLSMWTPKGGFKVLSKDQSHLSALRISLDGDHLSGIAEGIGKESLAKMFTYSIQTHELEFIDRPEEYLRSVYILGDRKFLCFSFHGMRFERGELRRPEIENYTLRDAICFEGKLWALREEGKKYNDLRMNGFRLDLVRLNPETFQVEEVISLSDKFK